MAARPIYYDTETTGIRTDKDRIIEIAAYDPMQQRTLVKLINPGCPIPPDASAIHHITDAMVADAPSFKEVAEEFISFCEGDVILIAHNNDNFDLPFLRHEFNRHQVKMPSWSFLDTLKWARRYRPDLPRHSLQFLREIYRFPANNAHRALDDVVMLHQIFSIMLDDIPIEKAYAMLNEPREIREISHMPFGKHQGTAINALPKHYVQWLLGSGALDKPENQQLREAIVKLK